jgi:SAM-dependent methyltransferase
MYNLSVYDAKFYDTFGWEAERMAPWFCPLLEGIFLQTFYKKVSSFLDLGCGEGYYLNWFASNSDFKFKDLLGIEGSPEAVLRALRLARRQSPDEAPTVGYPKFLVKYWDLRGPLLLDRKYDLALSLEVAEHVEEQYSGTFVDTLTHATDLVVMTAAPPGQGGEHHVNEQPQSYWSNLMLSRGFVLDPAACTWLRTAIDSRPRDAYITPWLRPNLMVFHRAG